MILFVCAVCVHCSCIEGWLSVPVHQHPSLLLLLLWCLPTRLLPYAPALVSHWQVARLSLVWLQASAHPDYAAYATCDMPAGSWYLLV
jgi:hypothetical protein